MLLNIFLYVIVIVHFLLICFVIGAPLFGRNWIIALHLIIVPFIVLHWYLNDNTCALTVAEYKIREQLYGYVDRSQCYMAKLIDPIYDFKKNNVHLSVFLYTIMFSLSSISVYKLFSRVKSGELKTIYDFYQK